jgi:hypothetical protein
MKNDSNLRLGFEILKCLKHLANSLKLQSVRFFYCFEGEKKREAVKNFTESVTDNLHAV